MNNVWIINDNEWIVDEYDECNLTEVERTRLEESEYDIRA